MKRISGRAASAPISSWRNGLTSLDAPGNRIKASEKLFVALPHPASNRSPSPNDESEKENDDDDSR
jgi:hypothetical protein